MKNYLILGLVVLTLACSKDDIQGPIVITEPVPEGSINWAAPEAGQRSLFFNYTTQCDDLDGAFEFIGDTLVVEVIEENGQQLLKEQMTEHSISVINGNPNDPIVYPITCDGEKVLIPERENSALFFFYGNDTLRLTTPMDVSLQQQDCKLFHNDNLFIGDDIGFVESFQMGEVEKKSKVAVSCVPIVNVDAYLIYDRQQLHVSHVIYTSTFMGDVTYSIQGWMLAK